ncbi:hypothetical protein IKA92_07115 [bacterium]|nr:hypothetical protein [bacterium]
MRKIFCLSLIILISSIFSISFAKDDESRGYKGTLPNLNKYFEYKKQKSKVEAETSPQKAEDAKDLKSAPFDDPIFMETIIKKPKNTPYVEDLLYIRPILIKFKDFLSANPENIDVQKYIARVNEISLLSEDIIKKYEATHGKDHSYIWVTSVSYRAKIIGNLLYERNKYSKYMDITAGEYSKPYIDNEIKILISELDKCIFRLSQLDVY